LEIKQVITKGLDIKKIKQFIEDQNKYIHTNFQKLFSRMVQGDEELINIMTYSLFSGGKAIRPLLVLESGRLFGGQESELLLAALAIEMIHSYSLIHDDLPAMDNDDFRRGKPSSHIQFGEANAILGGDALLTEAFGLCSHLGNGWLVSQVIREMVRASGIQGMIAGQRLDMEAEKAGQITIADLKDIHLKKTAQIIAASIRIGAMIALQAKSDSLTKNTIPDILLQNLTDYGLCLGLLFQITDDILDYTGNEKELGKPVGSDLAKGKKTYVSILGLDKARRLALDESNRARNLAGQFESEEGFFQALPEFILRRSK
jgi:geranylgeranyl diphosphate synthase type II